MHRRVHRLRGNARLDGNYTVRWPRGRRRYPMPFVAYHFGSITGEPWKNLPVRFGTINFRLLRARMRADIGSSAQKVVPDHTGRDSAASYDGSLLAILQC